MAKLSKEDFIAKLKAYTGDRTDDESLSIIEDASDSFPSSEESEEWKAKYEDLAKKYKDRFTDKVEVKEEVKEEDPKDDDSKEDITVDDLFTDKED